MEAGGMTRTPTDLEKIDAWIVSERMPPRTGAQAMSQELSALIERVEAADGPDRDIELAIVKFAYAKRWVGLCGYEGRINYGPLLWADRYGAHFTSSLDAALTLVPEGWQRSIWIGDSDDQRTALVELCPYDADTEVKVRAATPALALCAAALKARMG
jgi:hypothetical protein